MSKIRCLKCEDGQIDSCDGCHIYKMSDNPMIYFRAFLLQVPEPVKNKVTDGLGYCPKCGEFLIKHEHRGWCNYCGKKIFWE